MAYSTGSPSASAIDTDAPLLIYGSALDYEDRAHDPRWATTRSMSASDATLAGFEAARAFDGHWHSCTLPGADRTIWYFNAYTDPSQPIDVAIIPGHNWGGVEDPDWTLYTADDDAFTTNVVTMTSETSGLTGKRRVKLMASKYTNVERVSLKIEAASAWRPRFGELILGSRLQLTLPPREPFDFRGTAINRQGVVGVNGVTYDAIYSKGQRVIEANLILGSSTERDALRAAFDGVSDYGARPIAWIDRPVTNPGAAYLMGTPDDLSGPLVRSPNYHEWRLSMRERGPFYLSEVA